MSLHFLAVNLRRTRAERRRTQSEVAQAAGDGFSQQYVSALERGLQPSDPDHVQALAAALEVSVQSLTKRVAAGRRGRQ
jgi:transcriptional regulator with XRE-family HTH domain